MSWRVTSEDIGSTCKGGIPTLALPESLDRVPHIQRLPEQLLALPEQNGYPSRPLCEDPSACVGTLIVQGNE